MGLFKEKVSVLDAAGQTIREIDTWVDTGSTYTWLPKRVVDAPGVSLDEEREFILANESARLAPWRKYGSRWAVLHSTRTAPSPRRARSCCLGPSPWKKRDSQWIL